MQDNPVQSPPGLAVTETVTQNRRRRRIRKQLNLAEQVDAVDEKVEMNELNVNRIMEENMVLKDTIENLVGRIDLLERVYLYVDFEKLASPKTRSKGMTALPSQPEAEHSPEPHTSAIREEVEPHCIRFDIHSEADFSSDFTSTDCINFDSYGETADLSGNDIKGVAHSMAAHNEERETNANNTVENISEDAQSKVEENSDDGEFDTEKYPDTANDKIDVAMEKMQMQLQLTMSGLMSNLTTELQEHIRHSCQQAFHSSDESHELQI